MPTEFLPIAGTTPAQPAASAEAAVTDAVAKLADVLVTDEDATHPRFGAVTSTSDPSSAGRVQLDITSTAWCSAASDLALAVGDRVIAVQQGPVVVVLGRLGGGQSTPVGTLVSYAGSSAPDGWLLCNGAAVGRTTYAALFAVIGTTYGAGNGSTTFNLPDLEDRVPVGSGGSYSRADTGGAATVTITSATMPSHTHSHTLSAGSGGGHSHSGTTGSDSHSHSVGNQTTRSDVRADAGSTTAADGSGSTGSDSHTHSFTTDSASAHTHSMSGSISSTGSGGAHENMPPYIAVPYIIRAA